MFARIFYGHNPCMRHLRNPTSQLTFCSQCVAAGSESRAGRALKSRADEPASLTATTASRIDVNLLQFRGLRGSSACRGATDHITTGRADHCPPVFRWNEGQEASGRHLSGCCLDSQRINLKSTGGVAKTFSSSRPDWLPDRTRTHTTRVVGGRGDPSHPLGWNRQQVENCRRPARSRQPATKFPREGDIVS